MLFALVLAGCTGEKDAEVEAEETCAADVRAESYEPGWSLTGAKGLTVKLVSSTPSPPAKENNTWILEVSDADGAVEGATIELDPQMPDHGHGTSVASDVAELGAGQYEASPVNLMMAGYWEVTVSVDVDEVNDQVVFALCVEG